jgi:hypothetical protein
VKKRIHCAYCGDDLGEVYPGYYAGEPESCGKIECNREVSSMIREAQEERRERAEEDNYERY